MIDVECTCGRVYSVPKRKAGRKLQCKRCGAVVAVPQPGQGRAPAGDPGGMVIPFRTPDDPAPSPALDLAAPTRRCPSCGFADDATVVVCVRCGYDHRTGTRLSDPHEAAQESARLSLERSTQDEAAALTRLGLLSLTPAGLLLGPYVLLRTTSLRSDLLSKPAQGRLGAARVQALGGFIVWAAALLGVFALLSQREERALVHDSTICQNRLVRAGAVARSQLERGAWPNPARHLRRALEDVAESDPRLAPSDLRCPIGDGLYSYRARDAEELTSGVDPGYLLLWDQEPHADAAGARTWRALRFDGQVETFTTERELEEALARTRFGHLQGEGEGSGDPAGEGTTSPVGPTAGGAQRTQLARFVALADECDRRDPFLEQDLRVEEAVFSERTGVPTKEMLPLLLESKDPAVRRRAARMVSRCELPKGLRREWASELIQTRDPELRFAGGMALRRLGEPWLGPVLQAGEQEPSLREASYRLAGKLAESGAAGCEAVLREARAIRQRQGAAGDAALFTLPPGAFSHVARYLADQELGDEAVAFLFSAGKQGRPAVEQALRDLDPEVRKRAFVVTLRLVEDAVFSLDEYLAAVESESAAEVQASALAPFLQAPVAPTQQITGWLLAFLRKPPGDPAGTKGRELLARVGVAPLPTEPGSAEQIVRDLAEEGDHDAVLGELASRTRLQDDSLDAVLEAVLPKIRAAEDRARVLELLEQRPYVGSLEASLASIGDEDEEVRVRALRVLLRGQGMRTDSVRRDIARQLARRLKDEEGPLARRSLLQLCEGRYYCGRYPDADKRAKHTCSSPLLGALKSLARGGDRAALRTLSTHPSRAAVDALLELMAGAKGDYRVEIRELVAQVTGLQRYPPDAGVWRRELRKHQDAVDRSLENAAERERDRLLGQRDRSRRLAESLGH